MEQFNYSISDFWAEQLADVNALHLPAITGKPAGLLAVKVPVAPEQMEQVRAIAGNSDFNVLKLFIGGLGVLLWKYTAQDTVLISMPPVLLPGVEPEASGTWYCKLPLTASNTVQSVMGLVHGAVNQAYSHWQYDDAIFAIKYGMDRNGDLQAIKGAGFQYNRMHATGNWLQEHQLVFELEENETGCWLHVKSMLTGTDESMLRNMAESLVHLVANTAANKHITIGECKLLQPAREAAVVDYYNQFNRAYDLDVTVVDLFLQQASAHPDAVALVYKEQSITYAQLEQSSAAVAAYLQSAGASRVVGVMMDRSDTLVTAVLGILRSGAGYVPIDKDYPADRVYEMAASSGCQLIITDELMDQPLPEGCRFVQLDELVATGGVFNGSLATADDLAYVIYSSGTTGKPKGIMIGHAAIMNLLYWYNERYELNRESRIVQLTNIVIDIAFQEIFSALINGSTLYIPAKEESDDRDTFVKYLDDNRISFIQLIPDMLAEYLLEGPRLQHLSMVLVGGDKLTDNLKDAITAKGYRLYNVYGQTETAIDTVGALCVQDEPMRFDDYVPNYDVYIIDEYGNLCPDHIAGEIYTSGVGLAMGYINQPELTAEKFIAHPFKTGELIYRTGDMGKRLPDGSLVLLGRKDNQVKIRGYRVELGEIEAALEQHPSIATAVVTVTGDEEGEKELAAYLVGKEGAVVSGNEVRSFLAKRKPAYMVPAYYIVLDKLPLSAAGKVDRKQLPAPSGSALGRGAADYTAPRTETEITLANIWMELLGVERVGVEDDFFELGGHSLKATRLSSQVHKHFGVKLALKEIFAHPQLQEQAKLIDNAATEQFTNITPLPVQDSYTLSPSQKRLWVLSQFQDANIAYNMPGVHVFEGQLNREALALAFEQLLERHEILHTVFIAATDGDVRQVVQPAAGFGFTLQYQDLREQPEQAAHLQALLKAEAEMPFDLVRGPLLRATVYQVEDARWVFAYTMHHIISDGWSMEILVREVLNFYNSHVKGAAVMPLPLRIQYKDYAAWQQAQLSSPALQGQRTYWIDRFSDEVPVLDLPGDHTRPALKTYNGKSVSRTIPVPVANDIKKLCLQEGSTLFMGLLAAVHALLYRYTGQEDIIVGSPVAGREHADLDNQIGFYINTLALRTRLNGADNYRALLQKVKATTLEAYANQTYPFDELVNELNLRRDLSRSPLFDIMMVLHNEELGDADELVAEGMQVTNYEEGDNIVTEADLVFDFTETTGGIVLVLKYNRDIYKKETAERLAEHFENLLSAGIQNTAAAIQQLPYISSKEQDTLLHSFSGRSTPYPQDATIAALFSKRAYETPEKAALVFEGTTISYQQLDEQTNRLAHYFREQYNLQPGMLAGILLDRSDKLIIAILAVLKTGAGYVPLDPELPQQRKAFIVEDTGISLLLTQTDYIFNLDFYTGPVFAIDIQTEYEASPAVPVVTAATSANLAYVMYTSGSTGTPKGVMVEQRSVVRLVQSTNYVQLSHNDTVLSLSGYAFDGSVFDIFGALLNGATLVMPLKQVFLDTAQLCHIIEESRITAFFITTALFNLLSDAATAPFSSLRTILFGGERVSVSHVERFRLQQPGVQLVHVYGPTENTTFSTYYPVNTIEANTVTIPIGAPISNSTVYILDNLLQPVPIGVAGEICVGGDGLSRGYLNQPELTAEKFVAHPFNPHERLYRTGDLGRWLPDGNIEFVGRRDAQVKIRGFRIEPGEVQAALQNYTGIDTAVVTVYTAPDGEKQLAAYFTGAGVLPVHEIAAWLAKELPPYMLPSYYVQLDELPLNANGKIDMKRLPDPSGMELAGVEYVAPRNEVEEKLVAIWQEVLGRDRVGVKNNFFELGGHSLKATRLASQLHKVFEVKIELKDLFTHVVLEEQAVLVNNAAKSKYEQIPAAPVLDSYPLSSSQKRLWVLSQFEEGNVAYNMPGVYLLEGNLDIKSFTNSFRLLIARHENLRTVFRDVEGEVRQYILPAAEAGFELDVVDVRNGKRHRLEELVHASFTRSFDLSTGPLLRGSLYQVDADRWVFVYVMHHIVSDGWSMGILLKELLTFYNAAINHTDASLPALRIQYKDYAVWQQDQLNNGVLQQHQSYWLDRFAGELPVLDLPGNRVRPAVKTYNGGVIERLLPQPLSTSLEALCRQQGATLFMGLLAAVNTLLYRYTGQEDMILGSPVAGREHADLEGQIGFYVNTLALRSRFAGNAGFSSLLESVKQTTLEAYAHQSYPFDELVDKLDLPRNLGRHPLFDIVVALQNAGDDEGELLDTVGGLGVSPYQTEETVSSKFDLIFNFTETNEGIAASIDYNSDIYDRVMVEQLALHLEQVIAAATAAPLVPLNELDYIPAEEQALLINGYNDTTVTYPSDKSIAALFEEQVQLHLQRTAVIFEGVELSYTALNEAANRLAHYLLEVHAIQPGERVGLQLQRSQWMIVSILAVLKAGGIYVPVDPEAPQERVAHMIVDTECKLVLDDALLATIQPLLNNYAATNPGVVVGTGSLAYIMYTSGSTGKPKGVMVEQRSVVRLVKNTNYVAINETDNLLSLSGYSFDGSVFDIFGALLNGASVTVPLKEVFLDAQLLGNIIEQKNITVFFLTTALFNALVDASFSSFGSLRSVLFGGERVSVSHAERFRSQYPAVQLVHVYGPTENTTFSTYYNIDIIDAATGTIPIGSAISNSQAYVLHKNGHGYYPAPLGVTGEVYVSGDGLSRGYLNQPELTAEKFVNHPYQPGKQMYATGDLGRRLWDGSIEFVGRKDAQVKIRGFRIEPGEIEAELHQYPGVESAVVAVKRGQDGNSELVAYLVAAEALEATDIRAHLSRSLPPYMLPSYYVQLDELPLNANGKIDMKCLPDPSGMELAGVEYIAPRNEVEEKLVAIWQEVLGRDRVGVKDNFFELGGHSLKATRLASQLHKVFEVKIELKELFTHVVLEEQAVLVSAAAQSHYEQIPVAPVLDSYPLSSSQKRLWVLSQFEEGNVAYNMPGVYLLEGNLDIQSFENSFRLLIARHENLRTVFRDVRGDVLQYILPADKTGFELEIVDVRNGKRHRLEELVHASFTRSFDLSQGPLLRGSLYQVDADRWVFVYVMHHIISDGWSMDILLRELLAFYNATINHTDASLPALRIQYKDYAVWQQGQLNNSILQQHQSYWLDRFSGELPVLDLPGNRVRPAVKTYNGGVVERLLPHAVSASLDALCRQQGATLFMGLLAAVNTLLYRYTGQEDMIVGSPVAGREHADLEGQIGFYVNTLALRSRFAGDAGFSSLLESVKQTTLEAYAHQSYPFDELIDKLDLPRNLGRHPLFDIMVALQNAGDDEGELLDTVGGLGVSAYQTEETVSSKFDLIFNFTETNEGIAASIDYNSDIYDKVMVEQLALHLEKIIAAATVSPSLPLNELDYIPAEEQNLLITGFNNTEITYPSDKSIAALFEEQVKLHPDRTAVIFEGIELSYAALNEAANRLAHYLQKVHKLKAGERVGLQLQRSEWMIVSILAVLKAGGVYVPVDPEAPQERVAHMVFDTECRLVLDDALLATIKPLLNNYKADNPKIKSTPGQLAYIMYTSGSTGKPKGVMVEQRSVVRLVKNVNYVTVNETDNLLSLSGYSFDGSVFDIFGALLNGASVTVPLKEVFLDAQLLGNIIEQKGITVFFLTTALFNALVDASFSSFGKLRTVLFGGERVSVSHVERFRLQHPAVQLVHVYGPTENTTFSTYYNINTIDAATGTIPIGSAISNSQAYVLHKHSHGYYPAPLGITGEVYVSGDGLSYGYLNQPELTAEKFVDHPYQTGKHMYATGDLGRRLWDGSIEFVGRKDAQVKIRGFRIEPGEIEAELRSFLGVESVVVTVKRGQDGNSELVAYLVATETLEATDIRAHLSRSLPPYMLPAYYVQLDELPLNANGKIDMKRLPDPSGMELAGVEYVAPRNEVEEKLAAIWQEVLGRERVGVKDNFFELGGHSLKATRLASQLHKIFEVKIELKELFTHAVLEEQAVLVNAAAQSHYEQIPIAPQMESYPLSSSQKRLWVLSQFEEGNVAYNVPVVYVLDGPLDTKALEKAFAAITARHESLRTVFRENKQGDIAQLILPPGDAKLAITIEDIQHSPDQETLLQSLLGTFVSQSFNLAQGPLVRVAVYRVGVRKWVLGYCMHHIISDGWSMGVLVQELMALYTAFSQDQQDPLQPLRIQYKDYAYRQHQLLNSSMVQQHRRYWMQQFNNELPILELPADKLRPAVQTYNGDAVNSLLPVALSQQLQALCQRNGSTLFMGLLTAVKILLHRYTGQEDIIVGTVIAGREHADLENQIGFYVNTLPLRTRFSGEDTGQQLLQSIRRVTLDAYAHQSYPFDSLVDDLDLRRDTSRNPLFDVMVVLQNAQVQAPASGDINLELYEGAENPVSKFDLAFNFTETNDGIAVGLEYNTDIFYRSTAERLLQHFESVAQALANEAETPVQRIAYMSEEEKKQVLFGFNDYHIPVPAGKKAVDYFEEQAALTPNDTALVCGDVQYTYAELNNKANQFAALLKEQYSIQPDDVVAVKMEKSDRLIVAILGIMKSGAAYAPVDLNYPQDRIRFMVEDSQCKLLLDEEAYTEAEQAAASYNYSRENLSHIQGNSHMAYVIYTSGSTGRPKGVMVEHKSLSALLEYCKIYFGDQPVTMPLMSSNSFDVSIFEIFLPLISGGTLLMLSNAQVKDIPFVADAIKNANALFAVPSVMAQIAQHIKTTGNIDDYMGMRHAFTAGEAVPTSLLYALRDVFPQAAMHNLYGPTEATVYVTWKEYKTGCDSSEFRGLALGRPVSNAHVYILDRRQQLVAPGIIGELYAGGAYVARGYLHRPQLTAEKFIDNPHIPGERIYRTGDAAKWLADGSIEFIGRIDDQVKVRGFRIELGEIETNLELHEDITGAVVTTVLNHEQEKELVAYITGTKELSTSAIRTHLSKTLPAYMVPGIYVQLDVFPVTPNGKVNRAALPHPDGKSLQTGTQYVAAGNETEEKLVHIWKEFLNREQVGVQDNFFDLGGNSMTLIKMARRINTEFERAIPVVALFQYTTISALAHYIIAGYNPGNLAVATEEEIKESVDIMEQTLNLLD